MKSFANLGREFAAQLINMALFTLISAVILFIFRLIFISVYAGWPLMWEHAADLPMVLFNGLRFDLKVTCFLIFPWLAAALPLLFTDSQGYRRFYNGWTRVYPPLILTLSSALSIGDLRFFANFNSHFNIVLFDFFDEEPLLLMKSMWQEHPVILILIILVAAYFILDRISARLMRRRQLSAKGALITSAVFVAAFIVALRGSLGTFPLQFETCFVSSDARVNDCVPNALFMVKNAWSEKSKSYTFPSEQQILKECGFSSLEEAVALYRRVPQDSVNARPLEHWVFRHSGKAPFHPNVVLIITESWSNHLIDFDSAEMPLLGRMKPHLQQDLVWRNFQSSFNATINAVETMVANTDFERFFSSKYRYNRLASATAAPFLNSGYNPEFICGIETSWRNIYRAIPTQGFSRVVGKFDILKEMPQATTNHTWGVYDHCMLDYTFSRLEQNTDTLKPLFLMCLTSTSHTPFEFPDDISLPEITLPDSLKNYFLTPQDLTMKYLKGFQYSNYALGSFMDRIKNSPLKDNTIVIITGDHNIRSIMPYKGDEKMSHSVPLYMYLPENIRSSVQAHCERYGSHNDIIPTLAPLVFDDTDYFCLGNDLMSDTARQSSFVSINNMLVTCPDSLCRDSMVHLANARRAISRIYFRRTLNHE